MSADPDPIEPDRRRWLGFWCMIAQQTQNAFNDKMAQFILIPLGGAVGFSVESKAGLLIALPFVLFAPLAGWLSDRFSKRDVMWGAALVQVAVLLWISASVALRNLPLALLGFFALATQSAFFSPAKIGSNKELLGSRRLGFAAGVQQMTAMLAILAGQIVAGWLFDHRYQAFGKTPDVAWRAALAPLLVLTVLALPALLLAWIIPRVPAHERRPLELRLLWGHFVHLKDLWADVSLRRASWGVAFFWGFAAFINLWSVKLAKVLTGGGGGFGSHASMYMGAASLGMAAGFGAAAFLLRRRVELGWVPVAGALMTVCALILVVVPAESGGLLITLAALAFVSALFLAPLNAWMQDRYPPRQRGELQSAANLQDCLAGMLAVLVVMGFEHAFRILQLPPMLAIRAEVLFLALCCGVATVLIIRLLPADFIRVIGVSLVRLIYPIRTLHAHHVPAKGGVLMLPNHVTYADAFFLSAASPRPVRFVMDEVYIQQKAIRVFTGIFATVTIRRDQPLEAIREVIRALHEGDAVVLFPEGQLTRTGNLCALQRGFEFIARKTSHPVIPVWCDGSWGSIFSFEGNRFFRKWPRRAKFAMTVAYGPPLARDQLTIRGVRDALLRVSSDAVGTRFQRRAWMNRRPRGSNAAIDAFQRLDPRQIQRAWINGYQIGNLNALQRRQPFHAIAGDPLLTRMPGLFAAFPDLFDAPLQAHDEFDGTRPGTWVGGEMLRDAIIAAGVTAPVVFYDFSRRALESLDPPPDLCHCPCLAIDGMVIAMSMPEPPGATASFAPQAGRKSGSFGKLLPGWHIVDPGHQPTAHGPAAPAHGLPLPHGSFLDEEAFVMAADEMLES